MADEIISEEDELYSQDENKEKKEKVEKIKEVKNEVKFKDFNEAHSYYSKTLGSGETFTYNNKKFSTNRADDRVYTMKDGTETIVPKNKESQFNTDFPGANLKEEVKKITKVDPVPKSTTPNKFNGGKFSTNNLINGVDLDSDRKIDFDHAFDAFTISDHEKHDFDVYDNREAVVARKMNAAYGEYGFEFKQADMLSGYAIRIKADPRWRGEDAVYDEEQDLSEVFYYKNEEDFEKIKEFMNMTKVDHGDLLMKELDAVNVTNKERDGFGTKEEVVGEDGSITEVYKPGETYKNAENELDKFRGKNIVSDMAWLEEVKQYEREGNGAVHPGLLAVARTVSEFNTTYSDNNLEKYADKEFVDLIYSQNPNRLKEKNLSDDAKRFKGLKSSYVQIEALNSYMKKNHPEGFEFEDGKLTEKSEKLKSDILNNSEFVDNYLNPLQEAINNGDEDAIYKQQQWMVNGFIKSSVSDSIQKKTQEAIDSWSGKTIQQWAFSKGEKQKYLEKLSEREESAIKTKINHQMESIEFQNGEVEKIVNQIKVYDNWFKTEGAQIEDKARKISEGKYTTQEEVDSAKQQINDLYKQYNDKNDARNLLKSRGLELSVVGDKMFKDLEESMGTEEALTAYSEAIGRNPGYVGAMFRNFGHAIVDLGQGFIGTGDMIWSMGDELVNAFDSPTVTMYNESAKMNADYQGKPPKESYMRKKMNQIDAWQDFDKSKYRMPVELDDIRSFGDAAEWTGNLFATQIPNLALMYYTGGASLYLMGASSAGSKWLDLNNQKQLHWKTGGLYGNNYSFGEMVLNAAFTGTMEAFSEKVTLLGIQKTKGILKGVSRQTLKDSYGTYLRKEVFTWKNTKASFTEVFNESTSEVIAGLSSNFADIVSGNKDVNIYDGLNEAALSGGVISLGIQSPRLAVHMTAPFTSSDNVSKIGSIANRMDNIVSELKELEGSHSLGRETASRLRDELESEYAGLVDKSNRLLEHDIKRVDVLENHEKKTLIEIEKRNSNAQREIDSINSDPDLTDSQREGKVQEVLDKVDSRNKRKKQILDRYPPNVVDRKYEKTVETIQKMADMVKKMGGPEINISHVNNNEFVDKASKYDQNLSKKQVEKIAKDNTNLIKALQNTISDPDATPAEKRDAELKLKDANSQLGLANNILNSGDYGVMQPTFDANGNIEKLDIIINKQTSLTDGKFNTEAHEFIHATFANTLKSDPNMRKILGGQLKQILEGKGIEFSSQQKLDEFNERVSGYDVDQQGEEMMAIASEMMMDGDINFNDGILQKLKNVFRRFAQNVLKYDIKFDTTEDIKNFMRDYHYSLKNNKPSEAIARMLAKGANGKIFKDARTPAERKNEALYSRNIDALESKNPDWKPSFDQYTQNSDGTKRYDNKEDFQASDDFWPAFQEIAKSEGLKNLIASRGIYETGMNSKQEIKDFVDNVIQNVEDRYAGGLTKKARDAIKKIEDKRAKNELTPRETVEAIEKIENDPNSRKKGFDASAANGSLFGWITSVAVPNSIKVVKKEFIKREGGRGRKISTEREVGEGRTVSDILPGVVDEVTKRFESEEIVFTNETETQVQGIKVEDAINISEQAIESVENITREVDYSDRTANYKNVKEDLTSVKKITRIDPKTGKTQIHKTGKNKGQDKLFKPTKTTDVVPTGILFDALEAISNNIGVDPLRILAEQDLNNNQRTAAQKHFLKISTNPDGSFNPVLLKILPKGETRSGVATGIANTALGSLYVKGERVKVAEGALKEKGQKPSQTLSENITKDELLGLLGINPDGTFQKGTANDPAIRSMITQIATSLTNQKLRTHGNADARLKDGINEALYSKRLKPKSEIGNQLKKDIIKIVNSWGKTSYDNTISEINEKLVGFVEQLALENFEQSKGGLNDLVDALESIPPSLRKHFRKSKNGQKTFFDTKLFDLVQTEGKNNKGTTTKIIDDMAKEAVSIIKSVHPSVPTDLIVAALGFKDSGTHKVNGKEVVIDGKVARSTRTPNPKDYPSLMKDNVGRMINPKAIAAEEKLLKDNDIDPADLLLYQPMMMKGRVKNIVESIAKEPSLKRKQELRQEALNEINNINRGNQAVMKYIALKLKQARNNNKLSPLSDFLINRFQTNIIEGTRALSTLNYIYLKEGVQIGNTKPPKTVKRKGETIPNPNYDTKIKEYHKSWMQNPDWKTANDIAKKQFPNKSKNDIIDKTINLLTFKNEHINPSAVTHSKRMDYTSNGGTTLNEIAEEHRTFYGPNFVTDMLDSKVKVDGKFVDNKTSQEGDLRLLKFAKGFQQHIFNINGKDVATQVVEEQGMVNVIKALNNNTPKIKTNNKINRLSEKQSQSMKSEKIPEVKGMSTFDFDDTLAKTKSGVRARIPNTDGKPKPKRKVVFLAGGAGSGKGNVVSKLGLEKQGFKIVNQDISLEWLKKNSGLPENMNDLTKEQRSTLGKLGHQARGIAKRKMMKFQGNGDGVVVDGTGASAKNMQKLADEFKAKGYEVSMVFVETSLDVALERNRTRKERSLLDVIVKRNHESVMNNKNTFVEMFGDNFMEVKTDKMEMGDPMPNKLTNKMDKFVKGHEVVRLDAEQFAEQGDDILKRGGEFDFSEFNEVVDGTPGPLLDKAKERAAKYGTKDMFVLTARPSGSAKAIQQFLKSQGLDIPIQNITGLANSTGDAKAEWMLKKFEEGYNDMYFVDDAFQNVDAVQHVLKQLDVKSKVVQAKLRDVNRIVNKESDAMKSKKNSTDNKVVQDPNRDPIDKEFNDLLERGSKGEIKSETILQREEGRIKGKVKGRWDYFIPPSAEDFKGLLYKLLGSGKQGNADMKWFQDKLLKPFSEAIRNWNAFKQNMVNEYAALKKELPNVAKSLKQKVPGAGEFTSDHAVRVYLWAKNGMDIPGISNELKRKLTEHVANNPDLKAYADGLSTVIRADNGYVEPTKGWSAGTIASDLNGMVRNQGRKRFLADWMMNKNIIFSQENLNKLEAIYGPDYVDALKDILYRMENGTNRKQGKDKNVNRLLDWINGSVGAVMFFNMRSALLQTISTVNFINWGDNNIFKAAAAFANIPQFAKDFSFIFNSDMLKQRRGGLQMDVNANELTSVFAEKGSSPRAMIAWLLEKGFAPTRIADSFAIAFGGASMYRNRISKYIKEGMNQKQAQEKAWLDFQEIAEETQQSSRPDLISQQQAGTLGRLILAWQNTPMQMTRLMKKALSDLVNGRGDPKANVSRIIYYGFVQNLIFGALQSGLAFLMFGDDEEEKFKDKQKRVLNGALDTLLRGTGIYGAGIATIKNSIIQYNLQKGKPYGKKRYDKVITDIMSFSPPIGSKLRKIMNAIYTTDYNKGVAEEIGWRIENPRLSIWANIIEASTNIPIARLINKTNNLEEAITGNHKLWQRIALASGWNRWDVGIKDVELEEAKDEAKETRKEEKKQEKIDKKKKEEDDKKKQGIKQVRCSGVKSNGQRCGIMVETKSKTAKCTYHKSYDPNKGSDRDNDGIKEYQCKGMTSSGNRCKNRTENKNKKCYAHQ